MKGTIENTDFIWYFSTGVENRQDNWLVGSSFVLTWMKSQRMKIWRMKIRRMKIRRMKIQRMKIRRMKIRRMKIWGMKNRWMKIQEDKNSEDENLGDENSGRKSEPKRPTYTLKRTRHFSSLQTNSKQGPKLSSSEILFSALALLLSVSYTHLTLPTIYAV